MEPQADEDDQREQDTSESPCNSSRPRGSDGEFEELGSMIIDGRRPAAGQPFLLGTWTYPLDPTLSLLDLHKRIAELNPSREAEDIDAFIAYRCL